MIRRITTVPMGFVFLLAVALNVYLLLSVMDGARVVQQVEATAGQGLSCMDFYQARTINAYFDLQHPAQGQVLYLFSLTWPVWFALSIGLAFGLMGMLAGLKRWRRVPLLSMGLLLFLLALYLPTLVKISCAID